MGQAHDAITPELAEWIAAQRMFFVATAPTGADGHVNLSPKGLDAFRVLGPTEVAYLDLTGSGVETIAHLRQNGRITMLFCAFAGPPRIVRLYGRGRALVPDGDGYAPLRAAFGDLPGVRSVVHVAVERVATSCGYGVPLMEYVGERDHLEAWADRKGDDGLASYRAAKNARSIDGLPGLPFERRT